jgi:hypothetical protein
MKVSSRRFIVGSLGLTIGSRHLLLIIIHIRF